MKRLVKGRYRTAARAGLPGVRPRPGDLGRTSDETEAARLGYRLGWFVLRREQFGHRSREVYVFGAVSNLPDPGEAPRAVMTFTYDASGRDFTALGGGAVMTFSYDARGSLVRVAGGWGAGGLPLGPGPTKDEGVRGRQAPSECVTYSYDVSGRMTGLDPRPEE